MIYFIVGKNKLFNDISLALESLSYWVPDTWFYILVFIFIFTGIAGIIWVLFWFNITSDTPENDPLISEEEIIYLENSIPSDHLHKLKVSLFFCYLQKKLNIKMSK